jgi:hypothetical protein
MKNIRLKVAAAWLAVFLCALIASRSPFTGLFLLTLFACSTNKIKARLCAVTLSVPELLFDTMDAFKTETPELFQPGGFGYDFSSKTAVLGDTITARIAIVPQVGTYNAGAGGFKAAAQPVTNLFMDVPVTLNQFAVVVVDVPWLTQLASKINLYKEAVRNYGYALGRYVVNTALSQVATNFSNALHIPPSSVTLDTFDAQIRGQLNSQKAAGRGRYAIINGAAASQLGCDDRVRSSLFYGQKNDDKGYRTWRNLAGFSLVREYPDFFAQFAGNNLWGVSGDGRAIAVCSRQLEFSNAAEELNVPTIMDFYPLVDSNNSGLPMTGVAWQEVGTGDVYVGCGVLFGASAGNQGTGAGNITDNAGLLLYAQ